MNLPFRIANRLSMRGSDGKGSRTGVVIAISGVALALIIMQFTLSIVSGFKTGIIEKLVGFDANIMVEPAFNPETNQSAPFITANDDVLSIIKDEIPNSDPVLSFKQAGILKTENDFAGIILQAYENNYSNEFLKFNILEGVIPDYSDADNINAIVISNNTSKSLGIGLEDRPFCYFFIDGDIKLRRCKVVGIYESNFAEYDNTIAYSSIEMLQQLNGLDSKTGTRIEVRNVNVDSIESIASNLQNRYISDYQIDKIIDLYPVNNIKNTGAIYFNWLSLLDTNVVVIFILMLCVAGFTLISSLFILILEHIPTIGILRAIGTTKSMIRNIFIIMAMKMVGWGLLIGNVVGISLLLIQKYFKILTLDPEMYYLRHVPVIINWWWFILLNIGVLIVAWFILVLPAHIASGISPSSTIKYE